MKKYPSEQACRFMLRLPPALAESIKLAASQGRRSMNGEVVHRLEVFAQWCNVKHDPSELQLSREMHDQNARDGFLKTMANYPKPEVVAPPVTLKELAELIDMDRSACRQYILRLGYKPVKIRTASSGYQLALTVTSAQAREIQAKRAGEGYCAPPT